jgi:hypothetical protein
MAYRRRMMAMAIATPSTASRIDSDPFDLWAKARVMSRRALDVDVDVAVEAQAKVLPDERGAIRAEATSAGAPRLADGLRGRRPGKTPCRKREIPRRAAGE